ncbi:MAG: hypothetical protein JWQ32_199 [Marmoricola sp.]|nr:hypothetical protein [Marmoricola sp.]
MPGVRSSTTTRAAARSQTGATTAEYAVCTGAAVGFAGLLFKLITSETGQRLLNTVFDHLLGMLPF